MKNVAEHSFDDLNEYLRLHPERLAASGIGTRIIRNLLAMGLLAKGRLRTALALLERFEADK